MPLGTAVLWSSPKSNTQVVSRRGRVHLVDAADATLAGVQLEVRPVGRIASDDGDVVGCLGKLDRRTLDQMDPRRATRR